MANHVSKTHLCMSNCHQVNSNLISPSATKSIEPELRAMGLKIPSELIDGTSSRNPTDRPPLSDALVSVGPAGRGGTGSFVSSNGLILTNWHVAYDAGKAKTRTITFH